MARSEAAIPTTRLVAEPLPLAVRCTLGEGPRWDERAGELVWVDIDGPCVHRWRPGERDVRTLTLAEQVGAVAPRAGGGLVAATGTGLSLIEASGERATPWLELPRLDLATSRLNDGRVDAAGRLWVGAMARDVASPIARLYGVDPDGGVTIAMERLTISNGIGFAPGDRAMYHVDTPTQRVRRYPFSVAGGMLGDGEDFAVIPAHQGAPDGLAVDADGGVWVALWGGGAVHRYAPDGTLDAVVELPGARYVTAVAFGGPERDELYITTARPAGEPADAPFAGALHHCRPGVRGMPEHRFAA